jgi:2-oxoisovalerate dehydrogenase E2 component (dihydrolipoyl transacylase)
VTPNTFTMPDIGEGLTEAEIVSWRVAVGDRVQINQILAEIETAKAVVELPSPFAGVVTELLCGSGDVVPVGAPIIAISDDTGDSLQGHTPGAQPAAIAGSALGRQPVLVGYGVHDAPVARRPRRSETAVRSPAPGRPSGRPYATPPVRKLARNLGVDPAALTPTGARGQVTRADVMAAKTLPLLPTAEPTETRIPVSGSRKHIADAMVSSAFTAPHVTEWLAVDVTRAMRLLERLRSDMRGVRLTPLTLLVRATLLSLDRHPEINSRWDQESGEIVRYRDVNLGIAVASPRGLIAPNLPAANQLPFRELAESLETLITDARANRTSPERMRGGTFTITNIGVFGVEGATPIINPGASAILAFGQIQRRPWAHKDQIALRSVATLSLSFDHRLVDGELGSKVLADIARLLERPSRAFAW